MLCLIKLQWHLFSIRRASSPIAREASYQRIASRRTAIQNTQDQTSCYVGNQGTAQAQTTTGQLRGPILFPESSFPTAQTWRNERLLKALLQHRFWLVIRRSKYRGVRWKLGMRNSSWSPILSDFKSELSRVACFPTASQEEERPCVRGEGTGEGGAWEKRGQKMGGGRERAKINNLGQKFSSETGAFKQTRTILPLMKYRVSSIRRPGRLLNLWTLWVGAYSRLGAY